MEKNCLMCGITLNNPGRAQKYCKKCSVKAMKSSRYTKGEDDYVQTCQLCGHKFIYERRKKYCSVDCRLIANGQKKKPKPAYKSLNEIAKLCNEAGMTYGKYVAKYESR